MPDVGSKTKFGYRPFGSTAATPYVNAGTVSKITPAKYSFEKPEATILASTQKEFVRGLAEREAGFTLRRDLGDAAFAAMKAALVDSAVANYDFLITYSNGATQAFGGFVVSWEPSDIEPSGILSVDVTICIVTLAVDTPAPTTS